jgi:hypothetical protein
VDVALRERNPARLLGHADSAEIAA